MAEKLVNQLKQVDLFADLSASELRAVAEITERESFPAGTLLFRQGDRGRRAYLIESGELRFRHVDPEGIEREVQRLGPGGFFGETSLLLGEPHDATVDVIQDAVLIYINKQAFDQLLDERPDILDALRVRREVERKLRAPRFSWQAPDESVIIRMHKHNVTLIFDLIIPLALLLIGLGGCGYWYIQSGTNMALFLGGIVALPLSLFILYLFVDHFNDDYILTNKRVVDEERVFLIRESRSEAPLRNIQNVQQIQEGLRAQLFDMGDLIIETAGEQGIVVFRQIHHPQKVQDMILDQKRRVEALTRAEERAAVRDALRIRFGEGPVPVEKPPEPEEEATDSAPRFQLKPPGWLKAIFEGAGRTFRYLVPPLHLEVGNTVTWRKHWIILIRSSWLPALLILITSAILFAVASIQTTPAIIAFGTILGGEILWWLWLFVDWKNDIYQVTSSRIIDVEQSPFSLREKRREAQLDAIENVGLEIPSLLARILRYGSVTIETAGAGAFTFDFVRKPREVQNIIFNKMEAFKEEQRRQEAQRHRDEMLDWFSVYDEMRHPEAHAQTMTSPKPKVIGQEEKG